MLARTIAAIAALTLAAAATLPTLADQPGNSKADGRAAKTIRTANRSNERRSVRRPGILQTAASGGNFRTLVNALVAADLIEALGEDGPFTVFAPTDEAFAKIPAADLASLLKPENKEALRKLLTLHVVPGQLSADALASHGSPKTLNGARLTVASNRHGLAINEATVVKADILCQNGIIHVIDRVLTPSMTKTDILGVAASKKGFNLLATAIKSAGLDEALRGDGPFTVLAPTDEAFSKLPRETLENLLKPSGKEKLAEILKFHVIAGRLSAREVVSAGKAKTLQGGSVVASIDDGRLVLSGAKVLATDIKADNGIIHVIDTVLIPE